MGAVGARSSAEVRMFHDRRSPTYVRRPHAPEPRRRAGASARLSTRLVNLSRAELRGLAGDAAEPARSAWSGAARPNRWAASRPGKILAIRAKPVAELTDADYAHMKKVIGFCRRHLAQRPQARDRRHAHPLALEPDELGSRPAEGSQAPVSAGDAGARAPYLPRHERPHPRPLDPRLRRRRSRARPRASSARRCTGADDGELFVERSESEIASCSTTAG